MSREWCLAMTFCCVDLPFRSHTRAGWMRGAIDQRGSAMSSRCAHAPERQAKAGSGRSRRACRLAAIDPERNLKGLKSPPESRLSAVNRKVPAQGTDGHY